MRRCMLLISQNFRMDGQKRSRFGIKELNAFLTDKNRKGPVHVFHDRLPEVPILKKNMENLVLFEANMEALERARNGREVSPGRLELAQWTKTVLENIAEAWDMEIQKDLAKAAKGRDSPRFRRSDSPQMGLLLDISKRKSREVLHQLNDYPFIALVEEIRANYHALASRQFSENGNLKKTVEHTKYSLDAIASSALLRFEALCSQISKVSDDSDIVLLRGPNHIFMEKKLGIFAEILRFMAEDSELPAMEVDSLVEDFELSFAEVAISGLAAGEMDPTELTRLATLERLYKLALTEKTTGQTHPDAKKQAIEWYQEAKRKSEKIA